MAVRRGHSNGGRRSKGERRLVVTRLATDIADQGWPPRPSAA